MVLLGFNKETQMGVDKEHYTFHIRKLEDNLPPLEKDGVIPHKVSYEMIRASRDINLDECTLTHVSVSTELRYLTLCSIKLFK